MHPQFPLITEIEKDEQQQIIGKRISSFKIPSLFKKNTRPTTYARPTTYPPPRTYYPRPKTSSKTGSMFKKGAGMCLQNPELCLVGIPTMGYLAYNHLDATLKTKECMALCLPSNHPELPSQYQTRQSLEAQTGKPLNIANQPFCNYYSGNCDHYCKRECKKIHESVFSTLSGFFGSVSGGILDLMKHPALFVAIIIGIILIPIILKLMLFRRPPPQYYY